MLISILACSLGFHAITFERNTFTKIQACVVLNPLVSLFGRLVARSGRDRQTDRQTDGIMCMRIFRSDKMATTGISRTMVEAL